MDKKQLTNTVLMVEPRYFAYNDQTAVTNHFQHEQRTVHDDWKSANVEFWRMVDILDRKGVKVIVSESIPARSENEKTPDAVFPNWLTTYSDGRYCIHPLQALTRRRELQEHNVARLFREAGYDWNLDNRWEMPPTHTAKNQFVEGSGSAVINRVEGFVYAALSARTHPAAVEEFSQWLGYDFLTFETWFGNDPLYHTDLLINVGDGFFIWCPEVIVPADRQKVADLIPSRFEIIEISLGQMAAFCANIRQLETPSGPIIAMSAASEKAFTAQQLHVLSKYGEVVPIEVPTMERVGGGSVCCMIAEIFLPPK
jgi:hypothetical protein